MGVDERVEDILGASVDYYKAIFKLGREFMGSVFSTSLREEGVRATAPPGRDAARAAPVCAPVEVPRRPVLVLEGEPGQFVQSGFRVTNSLDHRVEAPLSAQPVRDANGEPVEVGIGASPGVVELEPGETGVVVISVELREDMTFDDVHRTVIEIPELSADGIALVIRRVNPAPQGRAS